MLYKLYLDESGTPDIGKYNPSFPYFILSSFIVNEDQAEQLKIRADQVKFKYWGRTNVVLHSREIGRRENDFLILKDPSVEQSFHRDLSQLLVSTGGTCVIAVINKNKAKTLNWKYEDVYREASRAILEFFVEYLFVKKNKGQIIIESAGTNRDILFYKEYIRLLSNGLSVPSIDHQKMKQIITSISFVSKNNQDIEAQIADLLAYPAGHSCLISDGTKVIIPNSYEDSMCTILNRKILKFEDKERGISKNGFINLIP